MGETAYVGVAGGTGTTRLCVETAATLARVGDDVAVVDAALDTQGLATYVEGRIEPDLTAVLAAERAFEDALVECWPDLEGRVACAPAHAPFERLARAKTPEAARRLEEAIGHASTRFDHVVVDVPPVASNAAVAAVTSVDQRVVVAPASRRGADLLPRQRGRLVDVGADVDAIVVNRADGTDPAATPLPEADHAIPAGERDVVRPTCADPDDAFAPAVAAAAGDLFDREIGVESSNEGLLGDSLGRIRGQDGT